MSDEKSTNTNSEKKSDEKGKQQGTGVPKKKEIKADARLSETYHFSTNPAQAAEDKSHQQPTEKKDQGDKK